MADLSNSTVKSHQHLRPTDEVFLRDNVMSCLDAPPHPAFLSLRYEDVITGGMPTIVSGTVFRAVSTQTADLYTITFRISLNSPYESTGSTGSIASEMPLPGITDTDATDLNFSI